MRRLMLMLALSVMLWPLFSEAVTRENFLLRNTQDFVELCTVKDGDPLRDAAIGFCHGYGLGAFHYYQAQHSGPDSKPFICLPNPSPTRTEGLQMFLAWARDNPQHMNEPAVESIFRFLKATWPCKK
jgi:Rap1a immunity proteins